MTVEFVLSLFRRAMITAMAVAAPLLLGGLFIGVAVSILQSVTQIQEMTLTFIPKILVIVLMMLIFMPWMANMLIGFASAVFSSISSYATQ